MSNTVTKELTKEEQNKEMRVHLKPLQSIWQLDLRTGHISKYPALYDIKSKNHILIPKPAMMYCVQTTLKQAEYQFEKMIQEYNRKIEAKKNAEANESQSMPEDHREHSDSSSPDQQPEENAEKHPESI